MLLHSQKPSSSNLRLKFVYVTSQLGDHDSLLVQPPKKNPVSAPVNHFRTYQN